MPKLKSTYLLIISMTMLLVNAFIIFSMASFDRMVYIIFFYHVASAWLSYISFGISLICHILYMTKKEIKWSLHGKNSVIIGVAFSGFTLITGSLWFNATSGNYNNIYWQWSDYRQTMTLILFFSFLAYLVFGNMIENREKKARMTALLGIVLFPMVPLSFFSAIIFSSLHPLITPDPSQSGYIYWDGLKIFCLLINLIAISIFYYYCMQELLEIDKAKEQLDIIIQKKKNEDS
ncbi:MAG: cytochrome c biogenesis protein CcsA [Candidatus Lokiarchaeota archaeon]|nr:cytochrome c biogenesis protein CcsA [Candidatus Lokiarchaeota archaeon]